MPEGAVDQYLACGWSREDPFLAKAGQRRLVLRGVPELVSKIVVKHQPDVSPKELMSGITVLLRALHVGSLLPDPIAWPTYNIVYDTQGRPGDLTKLEISKIQSGVDSLGEPLFVVGSAARGERRNPRTNLPIEKGENSKSDIDYLLTPSSLRSFETMSGFRRRERIVKKLPSVDPEGDSLGWYFIDGPDFEKGPAILFRPRHQPVLVRKAEEREIGNLSLVNAHD